jgi:hypothetical protein
MSTSDQFLLALQAYQEIRAELHPEQPPQPLISATSPTPLSAPLAASLPGGSLLLGLAEDGQLVRLDLYDPEPGPLLVTGDGGSGKTAFLKFLAHASNMQDPADISFGVLTPFPEEWASLETLPNCLGIWPAYHPSAINFLSQLVSWAEVLPETHQVVLLLFDGFDLMTASAFPSQRDLRWLLTYGPERQIWPAISVNPARLPLLQTWWDYFHTCIIGQVKHTLNTLSVVTDPQIGMEDLQPGKQFGLFQSGKWLKFWLPPLD